VARHDPAEFLERFGTLSRSLRGAMAQAYAALDVGSTQAKFLRHVGRHSGMSQADLARATATDPALTGRALETLIERGWVRRKRSEEDRRQYVLELSAAGERARKRVEEARERIASQVMSVLDERDLEHFDAIVSKIVGAFGSP
jgi:DNA-binding MarR family transcriptional regulator